MKNAKTWQVLAKSPQNHSAGAKRLSYIWLCYLLHVESQHFRCIYAVTIKAYSTLLYSFLIEEFETNDVFLWHAGSNQVPKKTIKTGPLLS